MGLYFEEFHEDEVFTTNQRTITEADVVLFAGLSGDYNALHTSEPDARATVHGGRIAHGLLVLSIATGLMHPLGLLDTTAVAFLGIEGWKFLKAVKPGDTLRVEVRIVKKKESHSRPDTGILFREVTVLNQANEPVQKGTFVTMIKKRPAKE
jgi:acyl dehydratase